MAAALQTQTEWLGAEGARQERVAGAGTPCILSQVALLQNVVVAWRRAKAWLRGVNRSGGRRAAERAWGERCLHSARYWAIVSCFAEFLTRNLPAPAGIDGVSTLEEVNAHVERENRKYDAHFLGCRRLAHTPTIQVCAPAHSCLPCRARAVPPRACAFRARLMPGSVKQSTRGRLHSVTLCCCGREHAPCGCRRRSTPWPRKKTWTSRTTTLMS